MFYFFIFHLIFYIINRGLFMRNIKFNFNRIIAIILCIFNAFLFTIAFYISMCFFSPLTGNIIIDLIDYNSLFLYITLLLSIVKTAVCLTFIIVLERKLFNDISHLIHMVITINVLICLLLYGFHIYENSAFFANHPDSLPYIISSLYSMLLITIIVFYVISYDYFINSRLERRLSSIKSSLSITRSMLEYNEKKIDEIYVEINECMSDISINPEDIPLEINELYDRLQNSTNKLTKDTTNNEM